MGNCLKAQGNDDISLLRGSEGHDSVEQALGPPPPYQACSSFCLFWFHFGGSPYHLNNAYFTLFTSLKYGLS